MLCTPEITFIENPSFIKHGFVVYISLICFAKLRSQSFAHNPRGSSSHQQIHTTCHCCHKGHFSCFYGCQALSPSENFLIQWTKLWHPTQVRDTALLYGSWGEMHSFPSSWKCCCNWKQDWLIHKSRLFVHKLQRQTWHRAVLSFLYL